MTEFWQVRGNPGAAWLRYHPAHKDGSQHVLAPFLRLILKDSGHFMVEARRSTSDKWTRFAFGHGFSHAGGYHQNLPDVAEMRDKAAAAGLLPNSLT